MTKVLLYILAIANAICGLLYLFEVLEPNKYTVAFVAYAAISLIMLNAAERSD